jgi:hypothetical protein
VIYVCVVAHDDAPTVAHDDAPTVGLLLWKVRQVLAQHRWEYHLLVADDASTDDTPETLDLYQRALPMSVVRHESRCGYATSMEVLLREAIGRTDRPKRDVVVLLPADFSVSPAVIPDLLKRFSSGADLVVGETLDGRRPLGERVVRRWAPWLLRPGLNVPGLRDVTSGVCAIRLSTMKHCFRGQDGALLQTQGCCANAELVARAATEARQIAAVPVPVRPEAAGAAHDRGSLATAVELFRAGRQLRIPEPAARVQRV